MSSRLYFDGNLHSLMRMIFFCNFKSLFSVVLVWSYIFWKTNWEEITFTTHQFAVEIRATLQRFEVPYIYCNFSMFALTRLASETREGQFIILFTEINSQNKSVLIQTTLLMLCANFIRFGNMTLFGEGSQWDSCKLRILTALSLAIKVRNNSSSKQKRVDVH